MKHRFLIFVLIYLLSMPLNAGDGVGNGGGISENNFVFAAQTLSEYIEQTLAVSDDELYVFEKELLLQILEELKTNPRIRLRFLSGRSYPDLFIYPFGAPRIAVTGDEPGSLVNINTDLLYQVDGKNYLYITIPRQFLF